MKKQSVVLACVVATTAIAVHARVLGYPFIMDDWITLEEVLDQDPLDVALNAFSPLDKAEYRPFGTIYFLLIARVFGLNPVVSHTLALLLHAASSLLVVGVLMGITRDGVVAWVGGLLYAAATSIHMEPLLWASGVFDGGSVFFALLCLWLFMRDRLPAAACAFIGALLFKESAAFLPVVLWGLAWSRDRRSALARTAPFIVIVAIHAVLKLAAGSPLSLSNDEPYAVRFTGPHVIRNVLTYGRWSIEALWPAHPVPPAAAASLLAGVAAMLLVRARTRAATCLALWAAGSAFFFLFLPNHVYRYYLTISLPAVLGLIVLALRVACEWARVPARAFVVVVSALAGVSAVSSFSYFRDIDRARLTHPPVEGTNDLARRGAIVMAIRRGLQEIHPTFPPRSILLFRGADVWAFGKDAGPRVWYRDPSIRVYDAGDLRRDGGRWVAHSPAENQRELFTGRAPARRIPLDCCPVFLFELTERGLVERPLE